MPGTVSIQSVPNRWVYIFSNPQLSYKNADDSRRPIQSELPIRDRRVNRELSGRLNRIGLAWVKSGKDRLDSAIEQCEHGHAQQEQFSVDSGPAKSQGQTPRSPV